MIHLRGVLKVLIFLEKFTHLKIDIEMFGICSNRLLIQLNGGIDIFLIPFKLKVSLKLHDQVPHPLGFNTGNLLKALFGVMELCLLTVELSHSEMGPGVPRIILDQSVTLDHVPLVIVSGSILLEDSR